MSHYDIHVGDVIKYAEMVMARTDKFLTEKVSLINFPFSQLFEGKLIFSKNPTELAKSQIHVHLLEKISLLETLFSRVNGCCYGYYNQLCVWGI